MVTSWACEVTEIPHKETLEKPLLCVDKSDLTSPVIISNHIQNIDIAISVVCDTFTNSFSRMYVYMVKSFILTVRWN